MFLFSPYFWLSCAALFAFCTCAPDPIIIEVDSQVQLPAKDYVYLLLYQKSVVPYANSVLIFDTISLSPKEIAQFVIPPLVVVAGLQYHGSSATEGKELFFSLLCLTFLCLPEVGTTILSSNLTANFTFEYDDPQGLLFVRQPGGFQGEIFGIYSHTRKLYCQLILFLAVALSNSLPTNKGQQYSVLLGRKDEGDFVPRPVVPPKFLIQTPGEFIETVMPTSWWLAVSTIPMFRGQEVHHSKLPANQVPIEIGQKANVTGNRFSGFNITVGWPN